MAITHIHPIYKTSNLAIDYICDPSKTDERLLVSSNLCMPETAAMEFELTSTMAAREGKVLCWHLIQAFAPGEIEDPAMAHEIGMKFAEQAIGKQYEYVVTTHIDKKHCHNHIIFNSVDSIDYKHYYSNKKSYYGKIQASSDRLCREYGLSVIKEPKKSYRKKDQKKTIAQKQGFKNWIGKIKHDIDVAAYEASTIDELLNLLEDRGYEIGGVKQLKLRPSGKTNFVKLKTLKEGYSVEDIEIKIKRKDHEIHEAKRTDISDLSVDHASRKEQKKEGVAAFPVAGKVAGDIFGHKEEKSRPAENYSWEQEPEADQEAAAPEAGYIPGPGEEKSQPAENYSWEQMTQKQNTTRIARRDIRELIPHVESVEMLFNELEKKGYTVRKGKHVSLLPPGCGRPVRLGRLGDKYSLESLTSQINEKKAGVSAVEQSFILKAGKKISKWQFKRYRITLQDKSIILTHHAKRNPFLTRSQKVNTVKALADFQNFVAANRVYGINDFDERIQLMQRSQIEASETIRLIDFRLHEKREILSLLDRYEKVLPVVQQEAATLRKSKYRKEHEYEYRMVDVIREELAQYGYANIPKRQQIADEIEEINGHKTSIITVTKQLENELSSWTLRREVAQKIISKNKEVVKKRDNFER